MTVMSSRCTVKLIGLGGGDDDDDDERNNIQNDIIVN